ncbi:hybrid sensor histidine kinase/response regulator transcription factor [Mucilaginibacter sp. KACC 22063]|uniref:hybrid sensor histidine kinase/response regulator transcription factor n=1 Tax=Mucilaginibacter sp. KACC 22063 TaxID=3025666 RepID=UPI0023653724|nr:hybrid sensor histidine kinase/response regulator transcription factor [Mucilaginibacter sp. KACC 22063]WDF56691.1 two-component regulator propeller domain-containing protein [Mucilaginibacter sp. KACC 22063]
MLKKLRIASVLLFVVLIAQICFGQPYYFKHYTTENGLSHNTVLSVLQDKKGFIWMGTKTGLNRFDGFSFKSFKNKNEEFGTIGDDQIHSMCQDSAGNLWLGTGRGIYKFDPQKETFEELVIRPHKDVHSIITDGGHTIWFISAANIWSYNLISKKLQELPLKASCLAIDNHAKLWIGTDEGTIEQFDPVTNHIIQYQAINKQLPLHKRNIYKILPLNNNQILIGTVNQGLIKLDISSHTTTALLNNKGKTEIYVRDILVDNDNNYWVATESGVYIYDPKTNQAVNLRKTGSDPYAINDNAIYALCKDKNGGIWIGSYFGGVNYYAVQNSRFRKYYRNNAAAPLAGNAVSSIVEGKDHHIWIGTEDAGVSKLNTQTEKITNFLPDGKPASLGHSNVHSLLAAGNKLYVGFFDHGLEVLDLKSEKVTEKYDELGERSGIRSNFVLCLLQSRDKKIFVGTITAGAGLFIFDENHKKFKVPAGLDYNDGVFALTEDHSGKIWIGSANKGAFCFDRTTHSFLNYKFENVSESKETLNQHTVHHIFEDSQQNLWFGTEGAGVVKLSKDRKHQFRYNTNNGLSSNYVYRVMEDNQHNIWMSSVNGLMKLNPQTGKIVPYGKDDGLLTDQFNYSASYKANDGTMYFGSVKGLISFKPEDFNKSKPAPPVYITGFEINNKAVAPYDKGSPLIRSVVYLDSLTLDHDQNNINFEFAALDYASPNATKYKYRMHGLNTNWTYLNTNRKVYFTGLAPGKYVFEIGAQSSTGEWNSVGKTIFIEILPPFYSTGWAKFIYALITFAAIYYLVTAYKSNLNRKHQRKLELFEHEKTQEIYEAKINFFTNVAHELRTPLTLIKLPLDQILALSGLNEKLKDNLNMIKKNTNRLIELTNQLLDFRKSDRENQNLLFVKSNVNALLQDIFDDFQIAANQKGLLYKLELPRHITLHAYLDAEAFKKILINLLSNAVKYAESTVLVKILPINSEDDFFKIEIKNDGNLIPEKYHQKIFEPFFRVNEKDNQSGSGIGLPLALSLTLMHKGSLTLATADQFNIFTLSLPLYQETAVDFTNDKVDDSAPVAHDTEIETHHKEFAILIVEDNDDIVKYIGQELKNEYQILRAGNGIEALEILAEHPVQLIVSDIMMPIMDGIELCRRIKSDLAYSHIPIILLTAKTSVEAKIEGLGIGADAYIEKPFSMPHLYAQIRSLLKNRKLVKEHFARSPLSQIKGIAYSKADLTFLETLSSAINNRLTDMTLSVETLSEILNMSRPTLYRKIKALTDMTPSELISLYRLKRSAELLSEGDYKINQVAFMIGYTSPANFTRDFQKQFGVTPSTYLKDLQK